MSENDMLPEVYLMLGRLEGKLDSVLQEKERVEANIKLHNERTDKHESRIDRLERARSWVLGAAAAAGMFVSLVSKFIFDKVPH